MPFGFQDFNFIQFPEGQTETRLRGLQNRLGINYIEFVNRVEAAMAALNSSDSLITMLTYETTRDHIPAPGNSPKIWQRSAEYTPGRPQRGRAARGHYLPIYHYEIDLGFTHRALLHMPLEQFNEELRETVRAVQKGRRADVLERLFNPNEVPLDDDGNGASPGFAGSGTGTNEFVGVMPNGQQTPASYSHYFHLEDDDDAILAGLKQMKANMNMWGTGPLDLLGTAEAVERIVSITGDDMKFVSAGSTLVRPGERESEAMVDPNIYLGVIDGTIRVREPELQLEGNAFALIRAGASDREKPLAWRYDEVYGREAYVEDRNLTPLAEAMIMQTYGVGVSNRTGAAVASIGDAGDPYTPPFVLR